MSSARNPGRAMAELAAALARRKVEPICTAYLALQRERRAASPKQLLADIQQAHGREALAIIVAAFSHRGCLMCDEGVMSCETCQGTGQVDRFNCPSCDGLGVQPCSFCQGAGWTDLDDLPAEFRKAALQRRLKRLEKAVKRLVRLPSIEKLAASGALTPTKRTQLATWLVRLRARMRAVAATPHVTGDQVARYLSIANRIDGLLDDLRPKREDPAFEEDDDVLL